MTDSSRPRHPALAATLSFLFPGLGQAYAGQRRLALILALPVLVLVAGGIVAAFFFGDRLRNEILSSSFLATALAIDVGLLAWRLFAILQPAVDHSFVRAGSGGEAALAAGGMRRTSAMPDRTTILTVALLALL